MLGTDERDLFVPLIRKRLKASARPLAILDIGSGDGQTLSSFLNDIPHGSTIDIIEPNDKYVAEYKYRLRRSKGVHLRRTYMLKFEEARKRIKGEGEYDLILCIHSIYFTGQIESLLRFLSRNLKPAALGVLVFADELRGFTGRVGQEFYRRFDPESLSSHINLLLARHAAFGLGGDAGGLSKSGLLHKLGLDLVTAQSQPARLFGHDIGDLLALGFINDLPYFSKISLNDRIDVVASVLRKQTRPVHLSLELSGKRSGMLSVVEPQVYVEVSRKVE